VNGQTAPGLENLSKTAAKTRTAIADPAGDWLCAWCLHRVANDADRFSYDGQDEFSFTNPGGMQFDIITFAHAPGCQDTGQPTLEHTWFPEHAWSYGLCNQCGQHLGWFYTGPKTFAGLIKDRLVRAVLIRN
jgi:hypothetical protein